MGPRILVAEDEPALLEMYSELLTTLGYECLTASDGDEAIVIARREQPLVVLTDYMMPGRTGVELIQTMKGDPNLAHVPVILISAARPPRSDIKEAWRFVPKPIDAKNLEEVLAEAVLIARERKPVSGFAPQPGEGTPRLSLDREDMLSWVAHEIKTPLSAALTGTELTMRNLRANEPVETTEQRLKRVVRQLTRMNELVNACLDAAQLQDGKLDVALERTDLRSVVEHAVADHREEHPDVQFELDEGGPILVEADPSRLRQILDNLLSNAVKYGGPVNRIVVAVSDAPRSAIVSIRDHGKGIASDQLPHIFDRFHRVPGGGGRGHGLGLYIAAALARLLGGEIAVESTPGDGSTFKLTLARAT
jgi:two-component system, sensor histidine kinase and response regulator